MLMSFLRLGRELAFFEHGLRAAVRQLVGHVGIGYAAKLWAMLASLRHGLNEAEVETVLDFGCGDGMYSFAAQRLFPDSQVTGVDGSGEAIARACQVAERQGLPLTFREVLFEDFRASELYDLVLCMDSIYYTADGFDYFQELCASVKPGGYILVSCPFLKVYYGEGFPFYTGFVDVDAYAETYRPERFSEFMAARGFEAISELRYPSRTTRRIIEAQRAGALWVHLLYPIVLLYAWLTMELDSEEPSHFMILARKTP